MRRSAKLTPRRMARLTFTNSPSVSYRHHSGLLRKLAPSRSFVRLLRAGALGLNTAFTILGVNYRCLLVPKNAFAPVTAHASAMRQRRVLRYGSRFYFTYSSQK